MEWLVANLGTGKLRRVVEGGRAYLVAPATIIVEGVLNGSQGPGFYPASEAAKNFAAWDGTPLTFWHPIDPDTKQPVSATAPGVWDRQGTGRFRAPTHNGKLTGETWFDELLTEAADKRFGTNVLARLKAGQPIELSTGLYLEREPAPAGATHNGVPYSWIARNYKPDHVAVLPDQQGACSVRDGCGVHVNAAEPSLIESFVRWIVGNAKQPSATADVSPEKACQILKDGEVRGQPLTDAQRGLFGAICGDKPTGNTIAGAPANHTEPEMKEQLISWLVANCACWKDGKDTLNKLEEPQLKALVDDEQKHKATEQKAKEAEAVANAARAGLATMGVPLTANMTAAEMEKMCRDYAAKKPATNQTPEVPVAQPAKRQTAAEWFEAAPAEIQEAVRNATDVVQRERTAIVERLTANVEGDAKTKLAARLQGKGLDELRDLLALAPPVANNNPFAPGYQAAPLFLGATGQHPAVNAKDDSDNVLPGDDFDWNTVASPKLVRK